MQKAKFIRKTRTVQDYFAQVRMSQQEAEEYIVEKTVELTATEYDDLANGLITSREWITENIPLMHKTNGIWHCIMAKRDRKRHAILIESEGYDYVRYVAVIE